jgi:antimicrobial peptide system SdpB family protein
MFGSVITRINNFSGDLAERPVHTNVYGLARSVLAMGLLLTLLFNDSEVLFAGTDNAHVNGGNIPTILIAPLCFGPQHLGLAKCLSCLILVVTMSGLYPRITGILHWWVSIGFLHSSLLIEGGDQITVLLTFFLIPVTLTDRRRNHWQTPPKTFRFSNYSNILGHLIFGLISIQMSVIYFHAAVGKLNAREWVDGTAIYYWFNHNVYGASKPLLSLLSPFLNSPMVALGSWGTILLEVILAAAVFMTPARKKRLFIWAIGFHLLIAIIHGLVSFFFSMAGGLIIYLLPVDQPLQINYAFRRLLLKRVG